MTESFILLTRPINDSHKLQQQLHTPSLIAPMLTVEKLTKKVQISSQVTDIIVTSPRVFEMFPDLGKAKQCIWCVGTATAAAARTLGLDNLKIAAGNVDELYQKIRDELNPTQAFLLHLGGETIHHDIITDLANDGFKGERSILYQTEAATSFPDKVKEALEKHRVTVASFYSHKSAATFVNLIKKYNLEESLTKTYCFVISQNIGNAVQKLPWKEIIVKPDLQASDMEKYHSKPLQQKAGANYSWIQTLAAAALGAGVTAMVFLNIQPKQVILPPSLQPEINKLSERIAALENQVPSSSTSDEIQVLSKQQGELASTVTTLKDQLQVQQSTGKSADERLTKVLLIDNILTKVQSLKATDQEIQSALDDIKGLGVILSPSEQEILNKRPMVTLAQLINTLVDQEPMPAHAIALPILDKVQGYVGTIQVKKVEGTKPSPQSDFKTKVLSALQKLDKESLNTLLSAHKDLPKSQERVNTWLKEAEDYMSLVQALKTLKDKIRTGE